MRVSVLAASGAMLLATACSEGKAESSPTIRRDFPVSGFTTLEVAGPFDVTVSTGKAAAVRAEGPQKLVHAMEVTVENGKLRIRPRQRQNGWMGGRQWGDGTARVTVSVPSLTAVNIAGSGDIAIDRVTGARFAGSIAGSGDLAIGQVAVQQLALAIAGSGGVKASGQAQRASYSIAGSGDLDAGGLSARDAEAEIAGSGSIRANVTGTARASIMGSGDIDISGGATCQQSKRGSGSIRCS